MDFCILTGKFGLEYWRKLGGTDDAAYLCGGGPLLPVFGTGNLCAMSLFVITLLIETKYFYTYRYFSTAHDQQKSLTEVISYFIVQQNHTNSYQHVQCFITLRKFIYIQTVHKDHLRSHARVNR